MYRWIDHTGELELNVESKSERGVLQEATRALAELLGGGEERSGGGIVTRDVAVQADDPASLLVAWLDELVFLAETEAVIPEAARFDALDERGLRARLDTRPGHPPRVVKAVTYHRLAFEHAGDSWRATVVFEV